jgi:hypothetical protein
MFGVPCGMAAAEGPGAAVGMTGPVRSSGARLSRWAGRSGADGLSDEVAGRAVRRSDAVQLRRRSERFVTLVEPPP